MSAVASSVDPFLPVATTFVPSQITSRADHPVPRLNIGRQSTALQTNKFYANFFLGDQTSGTWTHPYSLTWSKGGGPVGSWGMIIDSLDFGNKVFGAAAANIPGAPARFMINPIGIQDIVMSAAEFAAGTTLSTNSLEMFSANAILTSPSRTGTITFPMVQGMGFVTGVYKNLTPLIQTGLSFTKMTAGTSPSTGVFKYSVTTNDGHAWLIYAVPTNKQDPKFTLTSTAAIKGSAGFSGYIQIARNPNGARGEALYDASSGVYATSADLTGSVEGTDGSYTISWTKAGVTSKKLLMYALPHHVESFGCDTIGGVQAMQLTTTTKGNATAVVADSWTMEEDTLPTSMGFAPWNPTTKQSNTTLSRAALTKISTAAISELAQDMNAQTNLNSMYYSGKALAKFATIVYVANDILKNTTLATQGLAKLEKAFALFMPFDLR